MGGCIPGIYILYPSLVVQSLFFMVKPLFPCVAARCHGGPAGYPAHFREWSADGQGPHDPNTGATECAQQFCSAYALWLFDVAMENGPFIEDF